MRIKERLKTAKDRQKSYADKRCKPFEFSVGDRVILKEIEIDDKLHFVKERIQIVDKEVKKLKRKRIPIVKEIILDLATRATEIPLKFPTGMIWHLFNPTPSGKARVSVYFNFPFETKLAIGLNVSLRDPSPLGRILLLVFLLNSFHREGLLNFKIISWCSNNTKANPYPKHGLVPKTYSKKSLIIASIFGSKSKSFMIMSIRSQGEPLTKRPVGSYVKKDKESWALLYDLALYDNESWKYPRDFAKPVKVISMPHDVLSASDHHLIELENLVQRMIEAHLSQSKLVQVNKIAFSCEICSGPHDTQYCMEDLEGAFVENSFTRIDEAGNKWDGSKTGMHGRPPLGSSSTCKADHSPNTRLDKKAIWSKTPERGSYQNVRSMSGMLLLEGLAYWFGNNVASAFFASLDRFSCVNVNTYDSDDENETKEEAKDHPLMLNNVPKSDLVVTHPTSVEDLPV
uniref:MAK10-like protein n=1 Tax=Tanacetum cinerariifolium TaxID=118510 RepID=A0A699HAY3_TANCI|nr:MAK10-like protein [Tanacetum cinerariifolium]